MLIGIGLVLAAMLLGIIVYTQSSEHRSRNKELNRITARLEQKKIDELVNAEEVDVVLLWGDLVDILHNLQTSSKKAEGVQAVRDLASVIENENLILKKQGELIKISDIAKLQAFVDTYDPYLQLDQYLLSEALTDKDLSLEFSVKQNQYNSKKEAYLGFAEFVAKDDILVSRELRQYFEQPEAYFAEYYFDLTQRGIKNLGVLPDIVVLVDALARQKKIVYQAKQTELYHSLKMMDDLVGGKLFQLERFRDLYEQAKISLIDLSILEKPQGKAIFECIEILGYQLFGIIEDAKSYALFLAPNSELEPILALCKTADINLQFVE